MSAADLVLAPAPGLAVIRGKVTLRRLHMGFIRGLLAALVSDNAAAERLGTAFGMFNLVSGLTLPVAGVTAGAPWETFGPA